MSRRTRLLGALLVLVILGWSMQKALWKERVGEAGFVPPPPTLPLGSSTPVFKWDEPTSGLRAPSVHVASLCELSGGRLAAAWYGGSREGAKDTAIYFARWNRESSPRWTPPKVLLDRPRATRELGRYVKALGNPVIFSDKQDRLWLLFVSIAVGGWSGSSLNLKMSEDGGDSWTVARRLTLSPFFNVSELVRGFPLALEGGGFAVPIYHEFLGKFPEILWLGKQGSKGLPPYRKTRICGGRVYLQPSLVALSQTEGAAFLRSCGPRKAIGLSWTMDKGRNWTPPYPLALPNPDSGLAALPLSGGRMLLAFNNTRAGRHMLNLAVGEERGKSWRMAAVLEEEPGQEFSYPFMIRARDGTIHLVYTWKRRRIRHVWFNEAWILRCLARGGP